MRSARLELRVEPELLARVDAACGDVPRSRWVERAIERALVEVEVDRKLAEMSGPPSSSVAKFVGEVEEKLGRRLERGESVTVPMRSGRPQRHEFGSGEEWQAER